MPRVDEPSLQVGCAPLLLLQMFQEVVALSVSGQLSHLGLCGLLAESSAQLLPGVICLGLPAFETSRLCRPGDLPPSFRAPCLAALLALGLEFAQACAEMARAVGRSLSLGFLSSAL